MPAEAEPTFSLPKASKEVQLAFIRHQTWCVFWDGTFGVLRTLARASGWVGGAGFIYGSCRAFAGKSTTLSAVAEAAVKMSADRYFFLALSAILGSAWGFERRNRKKVISELSEYVKQLETQIDPNRSGSNLDKTGKPNKRAKDVQ